MESGFAAPAGLCATEGEEDFVSGENWIVFDLDGTLNRTDLVSVEAHRQTQREFGLPVRDAAFIIATFGGKSYDTYKLLAPGLDESGRAAYDARVAELERERLPVYGRPYDGVAEMLAALRTDGWRTAVCSNATVRYIESVLAALGLRALIDELRPMERTLSKAGTLRLLLEKVRPARAVMVGDRFYDREAARENGVPFIGCLYGFAPKEVEGCAYVVRTPMEIVEAAGGIAAGAAGDLIK